MKKEGISTLKVAATYIGTVVGAGFATGQEILQFFGQFGLWGFFGLIFTTAMFMLFGYFIMIKGRELNASSHLEIIQRTGGNYVGRLIDFIITFFLFGSLTAMIAGTGALFEQQFHLPSIVGNVVMAVLTALTVLTGITGVINSISMVVPFLLTSVIGISIFSVVKSPPNIKEVDTVVRQGGLLSNWFLASILYISYNTVLSVAVLGPLGVKARNHGAIRKGALLGGLGLGVGSILIYLSLFSHMKSIGGLEVPMIYIAGSIAPIVQLLYAFVLIAEVYTTAVGALFGFAARLVTETETSQSKMKMVIIITTVFAFVASQLGFSTLVKYLYPLVGYGGVVLLICLAYDRLKTKYT